ncbi:hypothetical protein IAQ61_004632 [Plenodomus lingam]|uniref:DUF924-domain-containing protein n=1 Tax=Leptosphaeria maculans (strain JN3 / isolate v23.1.3 / race Av1-4-5-6-7-8) TaxID=985895 RepID=E4ZW23_LEPMJ|nr:hypothetical protein LEMA_P029510.1 [Plenodomus lingam JN3]KAH9874004.1 hypothetical protein IAQ61_004632 [Plenodomus lingam]CBX95799.1 hypothetical protein LEMA_P029510.1 [Plenodomus lingam JN3]
MSTPPSFKLDPTIFNADFYKRMADFWFSGVDTTGRSFETNTMHRWFGAGSPDEKRSFDDACRVIASPALSSISPTHFPNPTAQPFLDELARVHNEGTGMCTTHDEDVAWTALALVLLLDQMPRNLFRAGEGLRSVYMHYDKMSYALASTLITTPSLPFPRPDKHPLFSRSAAHRSWFFMPLMHSEDPAAHDLLAAEVASFRAEWEGMQDVDGSRTLMERFHEAAMTHRDIVEKFGRYPHRNVAMGRTSTPEELEFLDNGGPTFGVVVEKEAGGEGASS